MWQQTKISYFKNLADKNPATVEVGKILAAIKSGKWKTKIENLRNLLAATGKKEYDRQKKNLPCVTFAGVFEGGHKAEQLKTYSGLICLDFDGAKDYPLDEICGLWFVVACFVSPSGSGIKVLCSANPALDSSLHLAAYKGLRNYFMEHFQMKVDESGSDICRLSFVSFDAECWIYDSTKTQLVAG